MCGLASLRCAFPIINLCLDNRGGESPVYIAIRMIEGSLIYDLEARTARRPLRY